MSANVPRDVRLGLRLAGIGHHWLELERAMGIENSARAQRNLSNHIVATVEKACVRYCVKSGAIRANASLIDEVNGSISTLKVAARNCAFAQIFLHDLPNQVMILCVLRDGVL